MQEGNLDKLIALFISAEKIFEKYQRSSQITFGISDCLLRRLFVIHAQYFIFNFSFRNISKKEDIFKLLT